MTEILDEGTVDELLVRAIKDHDEGADLAACHIPALCATVKHLRAELADVRDELQVADDALENQSQWMSEFRAQRDSLQSQLEQLRAENISLTKSLRDAYEFYMGPQACGDFTCACDQSKLCGICEIREATELALAKNLIDTSPVVNCNPSST